MLIIPIPSFLLLSADRVTDRLHCDDLQDYKSINEKLLLISARAGPLSNSNSANSHAWSRADRDRLCPFSVVPCMTQRDDSQTQ